MNYLANVQLSDAAGRLLAPAGAIVNRSTIPSDDDNVAILVAQGILTPTKERATFKPDKDAPEPEPTDAPEPRATRKSKEA